MLKPTISWQGGYWKASQDILSLSWYMMSIKLVIETM